MKIKRINGGLSIGRTWIGFQSVPGYVPRRFARRSGGSMTPGPWSEYLIPFAGSIRVSHDRTLFGWDDPANNPGSGVSDAMKVDVYPVGVLGNLLSAWGYLTGGYGRGDSVAAPPWAWRIKQVRSCLGHTQRTIVRHLRSRKWRELKNAFNGYLAEPTPFPTGISRCGSGWTKRRARRSLDRQLAAVASSPNPGVDRG